MNSGELWRKLLFPFRRRQFDRDLDEEMRFHLEMKAAEAGPSTARKQFGNTALLQEDCREAWGWTAIDAWMADVKYAARGLRKNPGFTIVAALTMALGIGATTATFSVVNGVLLRPLPYRNPDRLVTVWSTWEKSHDNRVVVSYPMFDELKRQNQSFSEMAAWDGNSAQMNVGGEPTELPGADVSQGFFNVFQVQPILGRAFMPEEHRRNAGNVTILSYGLWQRLGADRNIAGKKIQLGRTTFTVAGVMARGFAYPPDYSDLWFPHAVDDSRNDGAQYLKVVARLKPEVPLARALNEMKSIAAHLPQGRSAIGANVVSLEEQTVGDSRRVLLVLMGAVGCVFLIACANIANLLLVRATGRRRDLALRLALGARRWRVARELLVESLLLAVMGGMVGVAAAYWLVRAFVAIDPVHLPRVHEIAVDGTVLLSAIAATLITGIVFGLAPAIRASRPDLSNWLKEGPGVPGSGEFGKNRGRSMLAAAQIALSVMLLVSAGLMLRSFIARVSVPLGFRPEGAIGVELPWSANRRIDELIARLRTLPGVTAAGASTRFPQSPAPMSCEGCIAIEGRQALENGVNETGLITATPGYFEAAGIKLCSGRFLTEADGKDASKVVVINETMARREFGKQDALGQHVRWMGTEWSTIVGVVGNSKGFGETGEPRGDIYFANRQAAWMNPVHVLVRTAAPPKSMVGVVRKEIRAWNRQLLINRIDTVDNLLSSSVAAPRFYLLLVAGFAILALAVSAVGVYGTVNYSVARRTHEIGVRIALGAERGDMLAMVMRDGLTMTVAGLAIGLAGAWASARVLETLLFGVPPTDAVAFGGAAGVLLFAVLLACYVPARRATRVDPLVALRHE
jgi:putative ABC transport system permease protein